jgi:hypothetical protein
MAAKAMPAAASCMKRLTKSTLQEVHALPGEVRRAGAATFYP